MPDQMRALTVHQPWGWAIAYGGKHVENRRQSIRYRGPLAIHAGLKVSPASIPDRAAAAQLQAIGGRGNVWEPARSSIRSHWGHPGLAQGAVIAVTELVDCHPAGPCTNLRCRPWGEPGVYHLVLADVRPLTEPVPCRGWQGLWIPDLGVRTAIDRLLGVNEVFECTGRFVDPLTLKSVGDSCGAVYRGVEMSARAAGWRVAPRDGGVVDVARRAMCPSCAAPAGRVR